LKDRDKIDIQRAVWPINVYKIQRRLVRTSAGVQQKTITNSGRHLAYCLRFR